MFQTSALLSNTPYVSTPTFNNTQFSTPAGGVAGTSWPPVALRSGQHLPSGHAAILVAHL